MVTIDVYNDETGLQISADVIQNGERYTISYNGTMNGEDFEGVSEFVTNKSMSTLDIVEVVTTSIRWDSE